MKLIVTQNTLYKALLAVVLITLVQCKSAPTSAWQKTNEELIAKYDLKVRELSGLPTNNIKSNLEEGKVTPLKDSVELHPGVKAKIAWGTGAMTNVLQLAPNAQIPEEVLPADRFVFVLEGSIDQSINGTATSMLSIARENPDGIHGGTPRVDFVYMQKGSKSAVKAGANGAKLLEVYSPVRLDYLKKAGVKDLPAEVADVTATLEPNITPNKVYDLYEIQLTEIAKGAHTRLISGRNTQLSFITMDPGSTFPHHIHPEEQMMMVLRGGCDEILLDGTQAMKPYDIVRIPGNMVHGANIGNLGCDALDLFWPARQDYLDKQKAAKAALEALIPADSKPVLLVDGSKTKPGLTFSEGPKWMNGKVYFSNMFFDKDFNSSPAKSSTVEMDPDGKYRNISAGKMQTNGLYPYKNGNLVVCDMMGHRVVEMTTKGEVVNVLADKYNGKSIDGPNDVITDTKGGIYFTDPQFTAEPVKFQPGRNVYYRSPDGKTVTALFKPNEFAMPNGILLSPDGKTLYVNNCYDDESWYPVKSEKDNFLWAYDVQPDGTVKNGRKFAQLFLPGAVLDRGGRSSSSDGMAIDKKGNIYICTYMGVQIFNNTGKFVGMINLPSFPVSLCFGDADMKTLYIVSYNKVFKMRTNAEGYINYLK